MKYKIGNIIRAKTGSFYSFILYIEGKKYAESFTHIDNNLSSMGSFDIDAENENNDLLTNIFT